jgi:cytochrome P450
MADESTPQYGADLGSLGADAPILMSEHPQPLHSAKLKEGIEELFPGLVVLRRMGDIQGLTRSHAVRQFGTDALEGILTSGGEGANLGLGGHHVAIPLELDGPEHTKWRKLLDPLFAPRKIAALEARVRTRANELTDRFVDKGEVDAYAEWCDPLPSSIFLSIMGIPTSEREHFIGFKNVILPENPLQPPTPQEREAAFTDCEQWFAAEFDRRERTGDPGDDVIGWLMQASFDGRPLTRDELHGICNLLMIAGLDGRRLAVLFVGASRSPSGATGPASGPSRAVAERHRGIDALRVPGHPGLPSCGRGCRASERHDQGGDQRHPVVGCR